MKLRAEMFLHTRITQIPESQDWVCCGSIKAKELPSSQWEQNKILQHSEIPSVSLSPDLQQRLSALRWGWKPIPKLSENGGLKDILLDQLINSEETASDQKTVYPKASLCFLI